MSATNTIILRWLWTFRQGRIFIEQGELSYLKGSNYCSYRLRVFKRLVQFEHLFLGHRRRQAFSGPGWWAAHREDQNKKEIEENLRKNERNYRKMRKPGRSERLATALFLKDDWDGEDLMVSKYNIWHRVLSTFRKGKKWYVYTSIASIPWISTVITYK